MKPKTVAIIPARKGSKRLPGKNRKLFNGKILIDSTVEVALKCKFLDLIVVVSDDPKIIDYYIDHPNVMVMVEPGEIAQDYSEAWEVVEYVVETVYGQNALWEDIRVIYLQPTSPLRIYSDVLFAWEMYKNLLEPIASITYIDQWNYKLNGAIYISSYRSLMNHHGLWRHVEYFYKMPKNRSVNIDTQEDWNLAKKYLQERIRKTQEKEKEKKAQLH